MVKRFFSVGVVFLCLGLSTVSHANGNLYTLVIELENIKGLIAQQQRSAGENDSGRYVFRYDILQKRIDALILDINRHLEVVSQSPKLSRFK